MSRIVVVGAGALGSLLGALFRERDHDVTLLGRGAHVATTNLEGLLLTGSAYGPPRRVPVRAALEAPRGLRPDLVIVAVKTQDLERALDEHATALAGDAPVVALQNGLAQDDTLVHFVGSRRAVGAVASLDAEFVEPGHVDCARRGSLTVGAISRGSEVAAERAARLLSDVVRVDRTFRLRGARWTKLLVNLGNVIPAVTGLSFQDAARHPGLATANVRMIREGVEVAQAEGVRLERLPWTSPFLLQSVGRLPERLARRVYALRVRSVLGRAPAYGSTWQSLQRGRPIETAWLNGEIARRGERAGVPTPTNAAALKLAQGEQRLAADDAARALGVSA